jgi:hypothetical protein
MWLKFKRKSDYLYSRNILVLEVRGRCKVLQKRVFGVRDSEQQAILCYFPPEVAISLTRSFASEFKL